MRFIDRVASLKQFCQMVLKKERHRQLDCGRGENWFYVSYQVSPPRYEFNRAEETYFRARPQRKERKTRVLSKHHPESST